MRHHAYTILLCLLLSGCASNGFQEYYHPTMTPVEMDTLGLEQCISPEIRSIPENVSREELDAMAYEDGYVLMGASKWGGPSSEGDAEALLQAQAINACLVLWNMTYTGTRQGVQPVTTYTSGTTTTARLPSGETASVYTSGTSSTSYMPYSYDQYDYQGLFYGKLKHDPLALGIRADEPPVAYMQKTDSRNGILVTSVMKGSPAYNANIFQDDIIVSINGQPCNVNTKLPLVEHQENEIKVYRNGKTIVKKIFLPADITKY